MRASEYTADMVNKGCKPAQSIAWGNAPGIVSAHTFCAESATHHMKTKDLTLGISDISDNSLNLPQTIAFISSAAGKIYESYKEEKNNI